MSDPKPGEVAADLRESIEASNNRWVPVLKEEAARIAGWLEDLAAAQREREACAQACENVYAGDEATGDWPTPEQCAAAIRERGEP